MMLMARWLVVLVASLVVSAGDVFASAPAQGESACDASCSKRCPCCISKPAPADPNAPLAPLSSTRTVVAKDFQLAASCNLLLLKVHGSDVLLPAQLAPSGFPLSLPLFVRHCTFLI